MIYNNIYKKPKGILRDDSLTELGILKVNQLIQKMVINVKEPM